MLKRTILFILLSYISVVCIDAQRRWVLTDVPERVVVPKENNKCAEKVTLSSVVFSSLSSFYDVHTLLEPLKSKENNKFPLYIAHLIVPLTRCVQVTHVRK